MSDDGENISPEQIAFRNKLYKRFYTPGILLYGFHDENFKKFCFMDPSRLLKLNPRGIPQDSYSVNSTFNMLAEDLEKYMSFDTTYELHFPEQYCTEFGTIIPMESMESIHEEEICSFEKKWFDSWIGRYRTFKESLVELYDFHSNATKKNDGYHYLKLLNIHRCRLLSGMFHNFGLTEEAVSHMLSVTGFTKLFVVHKMGHFEGLCLKNIKSDNNLEFPVENKDLEGFWATMIIQINQIIKRYSKLEKMLENDLIFPEDPIPVVKKKSRKVKSSTNIKIKRKIHEKEAKKRNAERENMKRYMKYCREKLVQSKSSYHYYIEYLNCHNCS